MRSNYFKRDLKKCSDRHWVAVLYGRCEANYEAQGEKHTSYLSFQKKSVLESYSSFSCFKYQYIPCIVPLQSAWHFPFFMLEKQDVLSWPVKLKFSWSISGSHMIFIFSTLSLFDHKLLVNDFPSVETVCFLTERNIIIRLWLINPIFKISFGNHLKSVCILEHIVERIVF